MDTVCVHNDKPHSQRDSEALWRHQHGRCQRRAASPGRAHCCACGETIVHVWAVCKIFLDIAQCIRFCRVSNLAEARRISSLWQGSSPAKTRASARPSRPMTTISALLQTALHCAERYNVPQRNREDCTEAAGGTPMSLCDGCGTASGLAAPAGDGRAATRPLCRRKASGLSGAEAGRLGPGRARVPRSSRRSTCGRWRISPRCGMR